MSLQLQLADGTAAAVGVRVVAVGNSASSHYETGHTGMVCKLKPGVAYGPVVRWDHSGEIWESSRGKLKVNTMFEDTVRAQLQPEAQILALPNTGKPTSLIIHEARYGWAWNLWTADKASEGCKDVTDVVRGDVTVNGELHMNGDCEAKYFNKRFRYGSTKRIARRLGVRYSYGQGGLVMQVTTPAKSNETVCVHITHESSDPKASPCSATPQTEATGRLKALVARLPPDRTGQPRYLGASIRRPALLDEEPEYATTFLREFNAGVTGDCMKWGPLKKRGWEEADAFVDFCELHSVRAKGHVLVWHNQLPSEVDEAMPADELRHALLDHVRTTVGRYKGRVAAWDVVNEAVSDGKHVKEGAGLHRPSLLFKKLGQEFIDGAFWAAHEADPACELIYNDYNVLEAGPKADRMYSLVKGMLERGVPVHAVGFQAHVVGPSLNVGKVRENLARFASLKPRLKLMLSELDMRVCKWPEPEQLALQRDKYRELLHCVFSCPAIEGCTFWGFTDKHSWIHDKYGPDKPLLFDEEYRSKPAYDGCCDAILDVVSAAPRAVHTVMHATR